VGTLAVLDQLADHRHPGRAKELAQLGQIVVVRRHADAEGALACTAGGVRLLHSWKL
jgi:hypothetical protein